MPAELRHRFNGAYGSRDGETNLMVRSVCGSRYPVLATQSCQMTRWWCMPFVNYCRIHDGASRISGLNTKREKEVLEERAGK